MPDKLDMQIARVLRIPILLERKNAQQQIVISFKQLRAARTRCPYLRRYELNELWIPRRENILVLANVFLDRVAEAKVESAVIHADDHVRLTFNREVKQL